MKEKFEYTSQDEIFEIKFDNETLKMNSCEYPDIFIKTMDKLVHPINKELHKNILY